MWIRRPLRADMNEWNGLVTDACISYATYRLACTSQQTRLTRVVSSFRPRVLNLRSRVIAWLRELWTTSIAGKRYKKRLRDATRTHAHARRQYWIGYIQDTTARLTLAEQCRRLDGRTEERPAFCNYNNTQKKDEITFARFKF